MSYGTVYQKGKDLELFHALLYLHQDRESKRIWDVVFTNTTLREQLRPSVTGKWCPHSVLESTVLGDEMSQLLCGLLAK